MKRRKFIKSAAVAGGLVAMSALANTARAATQKPAGLVPVGSVVAFLKSLTGTPTLPDEFVECNGQTLSDSQSIYNGVVIPNLNGASSSTQRFLRGSSTSGTTGGTETHCHGIPGGGLCYTAGATSATTAPSFTSAAGTLPSYYEVVWVMRIK